MKLLLYNWAKFDNEELLGGGVSVFLKRLIPELVAQGLDVVFLSVDVDASNKLRIEATDNCFNELNVKSYVLLNAGVPHPHSRAFGAPELLESRNVTDVVSAFLKAQNPDVVNFHSIEGVPAEILRLKHAHTATQCWFTAHNYHLVCQQIQLFQKRQNRNCEDFLQGNACRICQWQDLDSVAFHDVLEHRLPRIKPLLSIFGGVKAKLFSNKATGEEKRSNRVRIQKGPLNRKPPSTAEYFSQWRNYNIETVSDHLDGVLAVSQMQKEILCQRGLPSEKVHVLNPAVSRKKARHVASKSTSITNISYWGYSNPGTGFSLFLDALELLAHQHPKARQISVLFVSDIGRRFKDRLALLAPHFKEVELIARYDDNSMPEIAATTDLAVISSVWQETYCQVAAELYFLNVPVLASSTLGFAGEHIRDDRFLFESGSDVNLAKKLTALIDHPETLAQYWETTLMPQTIAEHASQLINIFSQTTTVDSSPDHSI